MIQYNPIKISPSRPMSVDVANSLATTLREGNALARESKNELNAVTMALPTAPTEEKYKIDKLAELNEQIEDAAMFGNMFFAQDEISAAAEEITKDPIINDSIKSYQNYNTWKQSINDRTDLSQLTKNRIIAENPYTSTDSRTNLDNGQITPWKFNGISPVKDIAIGNIFDAALKRINPDYIYSEDFVFYDENGRAYNEYKPGITVWMTNKQTRESTSLTKEKIEDAVRAAINADQQYRDAINQERANIEWAKNQDDYGGQFDRFLENGEVVNYDEYITRLVQPLANASSFNKNKNIDEWDATTIQINSGNNKGNGDDTTESYSTYPGSGISFEGYKTVYTNTLPTEIATMRGKVDDEISTKLSDLGINMNNITVDINNPDDIIDYINTNEHLTDETKQKAIDYVTLKSNFYRAQNAAYNQMLEEATPKGRAVRIVWDRILNNKSIYKEGTYFNENIFDPELQEINLEDYKDITDNYSKAVNSFFTNYTAPYGDSGTYYKKAGIQFNSSKDYNNFINLYEGGEEYLRKQGYEIRTIDGKKTITISDTKPQLVYQFSKIIDEYENLYSETSNINAYYENKPEQRFWHIINDNNPNNLTYGLKYFNKIENAVNDEFGNQEILVPTINSATPDLIIDEVWGDVRVGSTKYTELKGKINVINDTIENGLRSGRPLEMNEVQIGDDETGEYRNVKRKELDEIQRLIKNPKSKIIVRYTTSINGIVPYCHISNEDGTKSYNFTYDGLINDPVINDLNKDIQYANIVNKYAYSGFNIQIGVNNDGQAISLKAENNGDDTFSFYLVDNNGEKIDGIKLDSYDAATLKRSYDALEPYIDKQFSDKGLTNADMQEIKNIVNIVNYTLINNYAQNVDGLDPRTIEQLNTYIQEKDWDKRNWLNINGVSPMQMLLGAIGLTYSEQ